MIYDLDIRTLSLIVSIVSLMIGIIMIYVYSCQKTYNGFQFWTYASVSLFVGMLLLSMRGILSTFLSVIVANAAIISYFGLISYGLNLFFQHKPSKLPYAMSITLFVLFFPYFTYINPDIGMRIAIISSVATLFLISSAYCVRSYSKDIALKANNLLISLFSVHACILLLRILYTLTNESYIQNFMKASSVQGVSFVVDIISNISIFLGLIIINMQRVEKDFLDSAKEVKRLKGIIPICMHCKGIRDDKGSWNQLEEYISEHTDAQFSHGICKECEKKYYN